MPLDLSARALIAEALLESLDSGAGQWRQEFARRRAENDCGAVRLILGQQVLAGLKAKYGQ